jgi:acyl-CoA synthetase (AMP-forming)/AMP-acid ligase II/NADP-dependent 3-hydroxy acid dehydrogenase YdfG
MSTADPLGPRTLNRVAEAARSVSGVGDAAAVVRRSVRTVLPALPVAADTVDDTGRPPSELDGGDLRIPVDAPVTVQQALLDAARLAPDKGTVFIRRGRPDELQTYPQLLAEAERVLAGLRAAGLRPGDAALFQFADNRAYLTAFWACVLGGFVPTPVAVAATYRAENDTNRRLHNVWHLLDRPPLLTDDDTAPELAAVRELWTEPDVRILTIGDLLAFPADTDRYQAGPESPVLNLLTSGSTGVPKCVQHTNATVVSRSLAYAQASGMGEDEVSLIWMPLDHVTVVHCNIRDVFLRCLHVNAKIEHFLADPLLWLDWADRYRATNTWAPNFAFAMVNDQAREILGERSWDLSRFRTLLNGGEPVVAATSHRFLELLAPHGLPADAMIPAWGMAETCSGVTYGRQHRDDRTIGTIAVDPASLGGTVREVDPDQPGVAVLSTVGTPLPGVRIRVVDDAGAVVPEGRIGELCITGRTMMVGYYHNDEANAASIGDDGWFHTGDLAVVHNGELVIAGRKKDQIVVRGTNYLAHEIETVVERVDGVRVTFSAATAVREPGMGSDRLAIFFVPRTWDDDPSRIVDQVRAILVREVGLAPDLIVAVTEAEFPKTASGKVQRAALAAELRAGTFAGRVHETGPGGRPAGRLARRQWTELPAPTLGRGKVGARLVLVEDDDELALLGQDGPVIAVRHGDRLHADAADRYRVDLRDRVQLTRLLTDVIDRYGWIGTVVAGRTLRHGDGDPAARLTAATTELTALLGAITDVSAGDGPLVLVLTSGAVYVRPGDRIDLGTCALPGLIRTAVSELPDLTIRQVDLPADTAAWPDAVRTELTDRTHRGVVAVRATRRWQPRLSPVPDDETGAPPVTPGGAYLVTGGLGGIAHDLAGYLLAAYQVRLLLIGRSPATGEAGERLAELASLGDVVHEQLDVADAAALEAAVARAEARWGHPLDGVLHLAGTDPSDQWADLQRHTLVNESPVTFARHFGPKVTGTLAVARVLERRSSASLVLFGSVNGEFGGHSFGAYATANSFLTGFADHWHHERRRAVHCLAWSMWTGVGMNRDRSTAPAHSRGFSAVDPADGLRLFLAGLAGPGPHLIAGLDLTHPAIVDELVPDRLQASELVVAYTADGTASDAVRAAVQAEAGDCPVPVRTVELDHIPRAPDGSVDAATLLSMTAPGRRRQRPAPPATPLEEQLARLWSDALDHPAIGRDDSFFDLGGNSLRATRLLTLVDDVVGVRLGTQELFEHPTVAAMAAIVAARGAG